jgi:hypothetical protein
VRKLREVELREDGERANFVLKCKEKGIYVDPIEVHGVKIGLNEDPDTLKVDIERLNVSLEDTFHSDTWWNSTSDVIKPTVISKIPPRVPSPKETDILSNNDLLTFFFLKRA